MFLTLIIPFPSQFSSLRVGQPFHLNDNLSIWGILLGGEDRKVSKRSDMVTGWKKGPVFAPIHDLMLGEDDLITEATAKFA